MRRLSAFNIIAFVAMIVLTVVGVHAATDFATGTAYYIPSAAIYKASPSTLADGDVDALHSDIAHNVFVTAVGRAADGATASGSPVLIGGVDGAGLAQALVTDGYGVTSVTPPVGTVWEAYNITGTAGNTNIIATQASGGTGIKNVCDGFFAQIIGDGTGNATAATVTIKDGSTAIWQESITLATGANTVGTPVHRTNLHLVGTSATAMTLTITPATALHTQGYAALTGYLTK